MESHKRKSDVCQQCSPPCFQKVRRAFSCCWSGTSKVSEVSWQDPGTPNLWHLWLRSKVEKKKGAAVIFRKPTRSGLTHPYWQVAPCPDLQWWSNAKGLPCSGQGSMAPRSWKQSNVASICRHPTWASPTSVLVCLDLWMKLGGIRHHDTRKQVGIHFKRGGVVRMCLDPLNKVRRQTVYQ